MELPKRAKGDEFIPDGGYTRLTERLRAKKGNGEITCLVVYCFDSQTRLLPFIYFDRRMVPAGARAVGAALYDAGFTKTRIVLQQWNPNFKVSHAKIDGRPPDVLLVSTMQIHSERAYEVIRDAHAMGSARPLILAGGPKVIYEPEHLFTLGESGDLGADCCVTGEEPILLELMDLLTDTRGSSETMLQAYQRCRRDGSLNKIPGLVYEDPAPPAGRQLLNTGIQKLLRNLDELPLPELGYRLLEPPSRGKSLSSRPLADNEIRKHAWVASLVTTHGCKFACNYCPIPAYNQRTWRQKTPGRVVEEAARLYENFGFRYFFGTDDNFFNHRKTVEEFFGEFAKAEYKGKPVRQNFRFATEATEFDVYRNRDLLPMARRGGLIAVWFGIEDMTAELINKGQTPEKTKELFSYMNQIGIAPMAMMMHHDDQPLISRGNLKGLLNQAKFLYDAGAASYQCTIISPAVGTRIFEETIDTGKVLKSLDGTRIPEAYFDGNHAIATTDPLPWRRQLHLLAAYAMFYNPVNFLRRVFGKKKDRLRYIGYQLFGNLALPRTAWEMLKWSAKLAMGEPTYWKAVPELPMPMVWVNEKTGTRPAAKGPAVPMYPNLAGLAAAGA